MSAEGEVHYVELCGRVDRVGELLRRTRGGTGLCRFVAGTLGPLLLVVLLDRLLPLPGIVRAALVTGCGLGVLYLLVQEAIRPWLRRRDTVACAQFVENRIPRLETSVVTAIQIHDDLQRKRPWFDRQMVMATLRHAVELIGRFNLDSVVDRAPLHRAAALAGTVALALLLHAALDFGGLLSQLQRLFGSFSEVRQELTAAGRKEITVRVLPDGKTTLLRGSSATLEATLIGFHSDSVLLRIRPEDRGPEEYRLETAGADTVTHGLASVAQTFEAVFTAKEVESEPVTVRVVGRPQVVNIQLECIYPTYVRRPPLRLPRSSGEITALKGCHVVLTIEANKALQGGYLDVMMKSPIPMAVGGRFARAVIPVEERTEYFIRLTGEDGFENERPRRRVIKVVHDQEPAIRFVNLGIKPDQEVQMTEALASAKSLVVGASDDYGIRKIIFHYDIEAVVKELYHEPIRNQQRTRVFSIPRQTWQGTIARAGELGLKVGDRLSFWAEVQDGYDRGDEGGPHRARTPTYHLVVVGEEFAWEDVEYRPDETFDFGLYDSLKRKSRGRRKPPRESITREAKPEMPDVELDLPYGHDEVPIQYESAWKAYTGSLME